MQLRTHHTQPQHPLLCPKSAAGVRITGRRCQASNPQTVGRIAASAASVWQGSALDCHSGKHSVKFQHAEHPDQYIVIRNTLINTVDVRSVLNA